ncbi:MAG: hypothetical protein ACLFPE_11870 [Bacteroidales bacterium]
MLNGNVSDEITEFTDNKIKGTFSLQQGEPEAVKVRVTDGRFDVNI